MSKVTSWSNSALTTLQQCGEKFRRRYIENDWRPPNAGRIKGIAFHETVKITMRAKQKTKKDPKVEEAKDLAATAFEKTWKDGVELDKDEKKLGEKKVRAEAKDFAVQVSAHHARKLAPSINPIAVEHRITVTPRDSDIKIKGIIDLIDRKRSGDVVRDAKSSGKAPWSDVAKVSQQLTMFAMLRMADVGKIPSELTLDYIWQTPKDKLIAGRVLKTKRTMDDIRALVNRINAATSAVEAGVFTPTNPDNWWCSEKFCEFHSDCPYVNAKPVAVPIREIKA